MSDFKCSSIEEHKFVRWCKQHKLLSFTASIVSALCLRKIMDIAHRKWHNYPPGPVGLPLLGSLLKLRNYSYFVSLVNCYGSVFMINAGFSKFVFLNDVETVQKAFSRKECSKRKMNITSHKQQITNVNGPQMILRRQLFTKSFVSHFNADYFDETGSNILKQDLFKILEQCSEDKKPVDILAFTRYSVFCLIWTSVFGKYLSVPKQTDPKYIVFMDTLTKSIPNFISVMMISIVIGISDFSQWILQNLNKTREYNETKTFLCSICEEWFDEFEKKYNDQSLTNKNEINNSSTLTAWYEQYKNGKLKKGEVVQDIKTTFSSGSHTTIRNIARCLLQMAANLDIQQRMYEELKTVIGNDGDNILKYITKLHTFRASIHEMLRVDNDKGKTVISMLPRTVMDDNVQINGYNIPKDAQLVSFNTLIRSDDKFWDGTADKLDINHFLDEDNKFKKNTAFSLFGYGRRSCPGITLAMRMIYMLIGKMVLEYKFHSNGEDVPLFHNKLHEVHLYVTKRSE